MRKLCICVLALACALVLASRKSTAQVMLVSNGQQVSETRVQSLFTITCKAVAEKFRLSDPDSIRFRVTLVLGDSNERVIGDELKQAYFIYMNRWDETQFVTSASRLAMHHVLSQERKAKLVREILRRASATVSIEELQIAKAKPRQFARASVGNTSFEALTVRCG